MEGKTYTVRKMNANGDEKCQMSMAQIAKEVDNGMFAFVDAKLVAESSKLTHEELQGAQEIMLTARLVGG